MEIMKIEIKIVKTADIKQLIELYKDAGWWKEENDGTDPSFIQKIIEGSFCFAIAVIEDKIIGMGRSISDGVSDAYIQDVAVLREFRGQRIGVKIMDEIIKFLKNKNITWIGLIAEPNAVSFYDRYGFSRMENYVPFLLKDKL